MAKIGETDYRGGVQERLKESGILLERELFGGSIYLAGRAVEGMLRGLLWKHDSAYRTGQKSLETGHGLREILRLVRDLGVMRERDDEMSTNVQKVGRLWMNNIRFLPTTRISNYWFEMGEIGGKRTLKKAANDFYDDCMAIVKRCEVIWRN
jgi:hypothetical protein